MTSTDLTRRRALGALAAAPVAVALPVAAAPSMTAQERIEHHFDGLVSAMADMAFGKWEVRVVSGEPEQGLSLRQVGNARTDAEWHLEMAREALERLAPGQWRVSTNLDSCFALVIRDDGPLRADDVTGTSAFADWDGGLNGV